MDKKKWNIKTGLLGVIGLLFIIISFFVLMISFTLLLEFPQDLYGLYIFNIIGLIFLFLEYKFVKKDDLLVHLGLLVILIFLGIPTYMSYTDHKLNHFFDENEIIECDKDISVCTYGIKAINPKLNYFFCADTSETTGSKENAYLKCEWREKI